VQLVKYRVLGHGLSVQRWRAHEVVPYEQYQLLKIFLETFPPVDAQRHQLGHRVFQHGVHRLDRNARSSFGVGFMV